MKAPDQKKKDYSPIPKKTAHIALVVFFGIAFLISNFIFLWPEIDRCLPHAIPVLTSMKNLSDDTFQISFAYFDGESGAKWDSVNAQQGEDTARKLIRGLSKNKGRKIDMENLSSDKITYPVYALCFRSVDEKAISVVWTNGYLIVDEETIYACEINFTGFVEACDTVFPAIKLESIRGETLFRKLASTGGFGIPWDTRFLKPVELTEDVFTDIPAEVRNSDMLENDFSVLIRNDRDEQILYSDLAYLQVCIDGVWYEVPQHPELGTGHFSERPICAIESGENCLADYRLPEYGVLPYGEYRLVIQVQNKEKAGIIYAKLLWGVE